MRKIISLLFLSFISSLFPVSGYSQDKDDDSCISATQYAVADGSTDVSDALQRMIDENPNRTLYFPDGTYLISKSLLTPADPVRSVHLELSDYAIIKAAPNWKEGPLVRLGGEYPYNSIYITGSNYGLHGGILDGSGVADGISIDSGRETRVSDVSIKHVRIGIHIRYGANSGSSDADIMNVNIVCNGAPSSVGVLIEGYDNSLTNMRMANMETGVWCRTGGNSLRNIHPLTGNPYDTSTGFIVEKSNNWFDYCYSDHFGCAFKLSKDVHCDFTFCWAWWYSDKVPFQYGIVCDGPLQSYFTGLRIGFKGGSPVLLKAEPGGRGRIKDSVIPWEQLSEGDCTHDYADCCPQIL